METEKHWITLGAGTAVCVVFGVLFAWLIVEGPLVRNSAPDQPQHDRLRVAVAFR